MEQSIYNLYKKLDSTTKTRFHASRRLRAHSKLSTYSVVSISLILILISLLQAYKIGVNIERPEVGLIQVFSSIAVLVYSLLIEKNDYSKMSEKMYSCASRLNELKQQMHPHLSDENHNENKYDTFLKEYHAILDLYETHSNNDFRGDYYRAKLEMPDHYRMNKISRLWLNCKMHSMHIRDFKSYPLLMITLLAMVYWLFFGIDLNIIITSNP